MLLNLISTESIHRNVFCLILLLCSILLRAIIVSSTAFYLKWIILFVSYREIPIDLKCLASVAGTSSASIFFLKRVKFYKDICSAWISRTSAEIFFSQTGVINFSKIKDIYCYFTKNTSMDFRKLSKYPPFHGICWDL